MSKFTAQQIVTEACSIAKCPGYTAQGGRALTLVLDDLSEHHNLKKNLVTETVIIQPGSNGPFPLPINYRRTYDLFYLVSDEPVFLEPCSLKEFDSENQLAGQTGYPYEWATDLSQTSYGTPGSLYVYPASNAQVSLTHRYYLLQFGIITPETSQLVPWFEDQDYLIMATATRLMRITDDSRYREYVADCEALLYKHLLMEGDEQQVVKSVILDPRHFKSSRAVRRTKLDPW